MNVQRATGLMLFPPNLQQLRTRCINCVSFSDKNFRFSLTVIQRLLLRKKCGDIALDKAALDEPVRCACGEHEQFFHFLRLGDAYHVVEDSLAIAAITALRHDCKTGYAKAEHGGHAIVEVLQQG